MSVVDLQKIAASAYDIVKNINLSAMQMVGLDATWCRLLPYDNGEDVIVQEYTLHSYECGRTIKVVANNSNYNVGNFSIDLFGLKASETLEINIDIETWKSVYGENTMPLKGDFVLIPFMHRPYEVTTSTAVHTIGERLTSWKCILGEWKHNASRKETEDFKISIDQLTNSQDRLFGEQISKEVADAVVEAETAYNVNTYVDPYRDADLNSIIIEDLIGLDGNVYASAYYDFSLANSDIHYKLNAIYDPEIEENHWIYSCWFKEAELEIASGNVKIKDLYLKEKDFWYFTILSELSIKEGDYVSIYRGNTIKLNGILESKDCDTGLVIKIASSDCFKASKKVSNWWTSGIWKIDKPNRYNLINGQNNGLTLFNIDFDSKSLYLNINEYSTSIDFNEGKAHNFKKWHYLALDMNPINTRIILVELSSSKKDKIIIDIEKYIDIRNRFELNDINIENKEKPISMCNIRLYENLYPLGDNYKLDMYSQVTKNASKLILVDKPLPANKMSFVSPIK